MCNALGIITYNDSSVYAKVCKNIVQLLHLVFRGTLYLVDFCNFKYVKFRN